MAKEQKIDRENDVVGITQATFLPLGRWEGQVHKYALTVDIANLTDPLQSDVKINLVVDKKIVKRLTIQSMLQRFDL